MNQPSCKRLDCFENEPTRANGIAAAAHGAPRRAAPWLATGALALLTACVAPVPQSASTIGASEPPAACVDRIRKHRADESVDRKLLATWVRKHPDDWAAAVRLASIHNDEGRPADALRVIAAAPEVKTNKHLLWQRARASADTTTKEAVSRQALAFNSRHAGAVYELATALYKQGRFEEAAAQYSVYTELRGFDVRGWYERGLAHAYAGDRALAASAFGACIWLSMTPHEAVQPVYWAALASLYDGDTEWPEAASWFREQAGQTPALVDLPRNRGPALPPPPTECADMYLVVGIGSEVGKVLWVGKYSVADRAGLRAGDVVRSINGQTFEPCADQFSQQLKLVRAVQPGEEATFAITRDGRDCEMRARAGKESDLIVRVTSRLDQASDLFGVGDFANAGAAYHDVLAAVFLNAAAFSGVVQCNYRSGDQEAIVTFLRPWAIVYPQEPRCFGALMHWQMQTGKWEELRTTMDRARTSHPGQGDLVALEGLLAMRDGRTDAARACFDRALCLGGGDQALRRLGQALDDDDRKVRELESARLLAKAERERAEAERQQAEADRRRRESNEKALLMLQLLGGLRGGGGGVPGVSTVPTGPTHLQQWSDQQSANGMWSHNMGR